LGDKKGDRRRLRDEQEKRGMAWGFREAQPNPSGSIDRLWLLDAAGEGAPPPRSGPAATRLRIVHVNDIHGRFFRFDRAGADRLLFGRFAAQAAARRDASGPDEAVLFLSVGDEHIGTVIDELLGWSAEDFTLDAGYRLMSEAGLDATTVGNHDLDRGVAVLDCGAREAAFPILCANLGWPGAAPAALAECRGLRIGLIGLITATDTRPQAGVALSDPAAALTDCADALAPHCDVLLLLSHCGRHIDLDLASLLAERAPRGDPRRAVIVGGHTHHALNRDGLDPDNVVAGVPILQAGCKGAFVGEALWRAETGLGDVRLIAADAAPSPRPEAAQSAQPVLAALDGILRAPLCRVEGAAGATPAVIAERYGQECALANLFADLIVSRAGIGAYPPLDLAMVNSTYFAAGLGPGAATMGDLCEAAPYAETVWVADVTARDLQAILDSNARRILRPEEGPPPADGFVHRGFLHFSARLRYAIALGADRDSARAVDVTLNGAPLDLDDPRTYALGLTTYLAHGGFKEGWKGADPWGAACPNLPALIRSDTGAVHRAEAARALSQVGSVRPALDGRLRAMA
jgi:2',3'-cyclic-nucleotide 2'-phosphodiesterase (5'-nucleotidase family)